MAVKSIERNIDLERRLENAKDLSDFCQLWDELKPELAKRLRARKPRDKILDGTVHWLELLADRIFSKGYM